MEPDNQNQSTDDIKPTEEQSPVSGIDGFVVPPRPVSPINNYEDTSETTTPEPKNPIVVQESKPKKRGRGVTVLLFIFIILFIIAGAGAYFYYTKYNKANKDLNNQKSGVAVLQRQIDTLVQQSQQLTTLQTTLTTKNTYITSLTTVAQQLKTACGKSCTSIAIPAAPTTTTTNQ